MTKQKQLTFASLLMIVGIFAGLLVRLINLGTNPLTSAEAELALQALQASRGTGFQLAGQTLYILFTSGLFALFGSSDFLARLVPALFGMALVASPFLYRKQFQPAVTIGVIWLLALEPGMIAASRTVNSGIIAQTTIVWTAGFLLNKKWFPASVLFALCLLSGSDFWFGLVGIIVAVLVWLLITKQGLTSWCNHFMQTYFPEQITKYGLTALFVLIVVGSGFLMLPRGLSSIGASISEYVTSWLSNSSTSAVDILLIGLVYSPLVIIFGIWGGIRSWIRQDEPSRFLVIFALIALLQALFRSGRDTYDLIWFTLPMIVIAMQEICRHMVFESEEVLPSSGISLLFVVIIFFIWQIFGRLINNSLDANVFWVTLVGGVSILLVSAILAILGWSPRIAGNGYLWGGVVLLTIYTVMAGARSANTENPAAELWTNGQNVSEGRLLVQTISDYSLMKHGVPNLVELQLAGVDSPSISWLLRDMKNLKPIVADAPFEQPEMFITKAENLPSSTSMYRGQDFSVTSTFVWREFGFNDWLGWLMIRKLPEPQTDKVILWVRSDLFPGVVVSEPLTTNQP